MLVRLLKASIVMAFGTGVAALLSMLYSIYLARTLGPQEYGLVGVGLALFYVMVVPLDALSLVVTRSCAEYTAHGEEAKIRALVASTFRMLARGIAVAVPLGLASGPVVGQMLNMPSPAPLLLSLLIVMIWAFLAVGRGVLYGRRQFGLLASNYTVESGARLVSGLALVHLGCGSSGGLGAYSVGAAIAALVALLPIRHLQPYRGPALASARLYRLSIPALLSSIYLAALANLDILAAKRLFSPHEAGAYIALAGLAKGIALLAAPMSSLAFPQFCALRAEGKRTSPVLVQILGLMTIVSGPALLACWLWPLPLVAAILGPDYCPSSQLLSPYALAVVLSSLGGVLTWYCVATDRTGILPVQAGSLLLELCLLSTISRQPRDVAHTVMLTAVVYVLAAAMVARRHAPTP